MCAHTGYQICPNSRKWAQFLVLYGTNEFRILSQSLYSTCTQIHSKKTCRCHISPLSLSLAPHNSQVYVAAIKRVEGRARLAGPREPDGTPAHSLSCARAVLMPLNVASVLLAASTVNAPVDGPSSRSLLSSRIFQELVSHWCCVLPTVIHSATFFLGQLCDIK